MAHVGAELEVFPLAQRRGVPVVVGPDELFPPCHQPRFRPSFLESMGESWRNEMKLFVGPYVVAFTSTRWNSLQVGHPQWSQSPPTVADCMGFALSAPAVQAGTLLGHVKTACPIIHLLMGVG